MHSRTFAALRALAAASSATFFEFGCDNCHDEDIEETYEAMEYPDGHLSDRRATYANCGDLCVARGNDDFYNRPSCYTSKRASSAVPARADAATPATPDAGMSDAGMSDASSDASAEPSVADAGTSDASAGPSVADAGRNAPSLGSSPVDVWCSGIVAVCRDSFSFGHGRRPEGFSPRMLATWVGIARDEAAAAIAFERMARELSHFGAPDELVHAAKHAAREEHKHAAMAASLATTQGASETDLQSCGEPTSPFGLRSLLDFALENAAEGVVRKSYGAMLNAHQSAEAPCAYVRALYTHIARNEIEHAALSVRVHAWAASRLTAAERARVRGVMIQTIASLKDHVSGPTQSAERLALGTPDRTMQMRIVNTLAQTTWSLWAA